MSRFEGAVQAWDAPVVDALDRIDDENLLPQGLESERETSVER